jgi:hypothetical protein
MKKEIATEQGKLDKIKETIKQMTRLGE